MELWLLGIYKYS